MNERVVSASLLLLTACGEAVPPGTVGPGGGTASFEDGMVEIEVPEGALAEDVQLTVTAVDDPMEGGIGQAYEFGPPGTQFTQPVTIRITFSEADIAGVEEPDYINAGEFVDSEWRSILAASFDSETRTLSFPVSGFGEASPSEEDDGSSSGALLTQTTACGDMTNLVAPASPQTVQGIPTIVVDPVLATDGTCVGQRRCRTIAQALAERADGSLPAAAVVVVRPGTYATEADAMMNQHGGETFPINTRASNGAGIQMVAPSGATLISKGTAIFETDSFASSFPVIEGFALETEPQSPSDPKPLSILITEGYAAYQSLNDMMGGGIQIDGGYAFIRSSTLTFVDINGAGSTGVAGDTPLVIQGNTFMGGDADVSVDVNCVTTGETYCAAICDGNNFMGAPVGIHAIGNATLRIEDNTFMSGDIGVLLGDLPATDAADNLTVTLEDNTFMGGARAKLVVSMPTANLTETDNMFQQQEEWPAVVWNGPAPWVEPVDIAYLENPLGSIRWWSIGNSGPAGRIGAGVCYLPSERSFVVVGGRNASGTLSDTWVFDLDSSSPVSATESSDHLSWTQEDGTFFDLLGSVPDDRRYDVAVASPWDDDEPCLLFGGHNGIDPDGGGAETEEVFSDLYFFDENERWWELITPLPDPDADPQNNVPAARYGASFSAIGENLYVLVGGIDEEGTALQDVWVYNRMTNTWDKRADTIGGRAFHGAIGSDPNVALFFGGVMGGGQANRTVYRYEYGGLSADEWLEVSGVDSSLVRGELSLALLSRSSSNAYRYMTFGGSELVDQVLTYRGESLLLTGANSQLISGVSDYSAPAVDPEETNPPPSRFPVSRGRYVMASSTSPEDYGMSGPRDDIAVLLFGGTDGMTVFADTWVYMPGGD